MKRYGFMSGDCQLFAQDDTGRVFYVGKSQGKRAWMSSIGSGCLQRLQRTPELDVFFDTIQEALEYWPDHMCDGKKCSEYDWFEEELQAVMKELL